MAATIPMCPECSGPMRHEGSTRYICLSGTSPNAVQHRFACPSCGREVGTMEVLGYSGTIAPIGSIDSVTYELDAEGKLVVEWPD